MWGVTLLCVGECMGRFFIQICHHRFSETIIPIEIGKLHAATSCSLLQQPASALYPPSPQLPESQVPSPGAAGRPWTPLLPVGAVPQQAVTTLFLLCNICCPAGAPGCPLCSTVLLMDPAAAEFRKMIDCRPLMR